MSYRIALVRKRFFIGNALNWKSHFGPSVHDAPMWHKWFRFSFSRRETWWFYMHYFGALFSSLILHRIVLRRPDQKCMDTFVNKAWKNLANIKSPLFIFSFFRIKKNKTLKNIHQCNKGWSCKLFSMIIMYNILCLVQKLFYFLCPNLNSA